MTFGASATAGRRLDLLALAAVVLAAVAMAFGLPPRPLPTDSFLMIDYGLNTRQASTIHWPARFAETNARRASNTPSAVPER